MQTILIDEETHLVDMNRDMQRHNGPLVKLYFLDLRWPHNWIIFDDGTHIGLIQKITKKH